MDIQWTFILGMIIKFITKKGLVPVVRLNGTSDISWEHVKNKQGDKMKNTEKTWLDIFMETHVPQTQEEKTIKYVEKNGYLPCKYEWENKQWFLLNGTNN
jgi:hypothetical protein